MSREMESTGIRFEVQWKKKSGLVGRREDITSIGLWDPEDSSLDWKTFKTYLVNPDHVKEHTFLNSVVSQNLGTLDDLSVVYVDSEGDELPIESECEFQEALKFARDRARKGKEAVLKVDRLGSASISPPSSNSSESVLSKPLMLRCDKTKHGKFSSKKASAASDARVAGHEEKKVKLKKHSPCGDHSTSEQSKKELVTKIIEMLNPKTDNGSPSSVAEADNEDVAPQWFRKSIQKLKTEIVNEVTARVLHGMQQMLEHQTGYSSQDRTDTTWPTSKSKKKKRVSDEDSSDCALGSDSRDHKLLKKIEKLHKREKKLEKKLDSKLEKLENKTKRMMEKKSQSKARVDRVPEKKVSVGSRKKSSDVLTGTYLMDAILLNDGPKTEIHIQPGECFTKVWEIMNTGTLPWTDKTELRQAWGTMGLEPAETVVKCPILEPGEKGLIAVNFRAPEFPGTFESYWHFYHMGDRFGHWIRCAVVVDSKEERLEKRDLENLEQVDENKNRTEHPVDLTVKSKNEQESKLCMYDTGREMNTSCNATERKANPAKSKDPEYESESDSDNLSVISGTVSLSSDSEEDENFVVVQMPACFLYDVPLGTVDKVPVLVKEGKKKIVNSHLEEHVKSNDLIQLPHDNQPNDDSDSKSDAPSKPANSVEELQPLLSEESCDSEPQPHGSVTVTISNSDNNQQPRTVTVTTSNSLFIPEENADSKHQPHTVTVTRSSSLFVPDESADSKHQPRTVTVTKSNNLFVQFSNENVNQNSENSTKDHEVPIYTSVGDSKPSERVFSIDTEGHCRMESLQSEQTVKFQKLSDKKIYAVDMSGHCMPIETTHFGETEIKGHSATSTYSTSRSSSSTSSHHQTESPRKQSQTQDSSKSKAGTPTQSSPPPHQDPLANVIHILPETLVSGAVNVATSAFSTAQRVFSNLRSKQPGDFGDWNSNGADDISASTDRSTTESLNLLLEMGFTNKVLNVLLLQRYDNDVAKVVAELLTYEEHRVNRKGKAI